jgi:hypothetical protein
MAMKMEELKKLMEGEKLKYFIDPSRPALMLSLKGMAGTYQFVVLLEIEGTFIQFRTLHYLQCPADHPHLLEVLKVIGSLDCLKRFIKFGWDPSDGEIVGYSDITLGEDGRLEQKQFHQAIGFFVTGVDISYKRLQETIETGKDPGNLNPAQVASTLLGSAGSLPEELRKLLEKLGGQSPSGSGKKPEPDLDQI